MKQGNNWLGNLLALWLVALYFLALLSSKAVAVDGKFACRDESMEEWFAYQVRLAYIDVKLLNKESNGIESVTINDENLGKIYLNSIKAMQERLLKNGDCVYVEFGKSKGGAE